ncbi:MAG: hypothetical protein KDA21_02805 [Phycisphaerales bacterium]|nr:hypothetical protein [Phycisphaerales bacterium]
MNNAAAETSTPGARIAETRSATYELEVEIEAPADAVWDALIHRPGAWWLPDFHCLGEGSEIRFEPRAGGQFIESHPQRGSLLWFTVHWFRPEDRAIHFYGHASPEWAGPATSMLRLRVVDTPTGSKLELQDAIFGVVTDGHLASMQEGWMILFRDGLKKLVEAGG